MQVTFYLQDLALPELDGWAYYGAMSQGLIVGKS